MNDIEDELNVGDVLREFTPDGKINHYMVIAPPAISGTGSSMSKWKLHNIATGQVIHKLIAELISNRYEIIQRS